MIVKLWGVNLAKMSGSIVMPNMTFIKKNHIVRFKMKKLNSLKNENIF